MGIGSLVTAGQDFEKIALNSIKVIVQLYTDYSHFIYEILQNAEDCQATQIKFVMTDSMLEIYHNGMPFTEDNLRALCSVAESDKLQDRINNIGQFGVGFKSVFSVCKSLKLYSNVDNATVFPQQKCESFGVEIKDFIKAVDIDKKPIFAPYTTLFEVPFSVGESYNGYNDKNVLIKCVSDKLCSLNANTLLFLKHLKTITYEIYTGIKRETGTYSLKQVKAPNGANCQKIEAIKEVQNNKNSSSYLLYSRPITVSGVEKTIDIAFSTNSKGEFVQTSSEYVSVYFPTQVESDLNFLVQGPYKTSPDRSNIPFDDEDNEYIVKETGKLLYEAILDLRDHKLITLDFINLLPIKKNNPINPNSGKEYKDSDLEYESQNPWRYRLLYSVVKYLMKYDKILPTISNDYVNPEEAVLFRGEKLGQLFSDKQLNVFLGKPEKDEDMISWNDDPAEDFDNKLLIDAGIITEDDLESPEFDNYKKLSYEITETSKTYRELNEYLTSELQTLYFRPETLYQKGDLDSFLPKQDDTWLIEFYSTMSTFPFVFTTKEYNPMLTKKIVKTETSKFVAPFIEERVGRSATYRNNNVFLPAAYKMPKLNYVSKLQYDKNKDFFENILKIKQADQFNSFNASIESRYHGENAPTDEEHIEDMKNVLKALESSVNCESMKTTLESLDFFVRGISLKDNNVCYYPVSYVLEEENIFASSCEGPVSPEQYFKYIRDSIDDDDEEAILDYEFYESNGISPERISKLLPLKIKIYLGYEENAYDWYYYDGNTMARDLGSFNSKFDLPYLRDLLRFFESDSEEIEKEQKKAISQMLMEIFVFYKDVIHGIRAIGKTKTENKPAKCKMLTSYLYHLDSVKWIYTNRNKFEAPEKLTKLDLNLELYGDIDSDNGFYEALGFVSNEETSSYDKVKEIDKLDDDTQDKILDRLFRKKYGYSVWDLKEQPLLRAEYPDVQEEEVSFPVQPVKNLVFLRNNTYKRFIDSSPVQYRQVLRKIRTSADNPSKKAFIRDAYTDNQHHQFCQLCGKPFGHTLATQLENEPLKEIPELHLSLCYECNFKYREQRDYDSDIYKNFINKIEKYNFSSDDEPIAIPFGEEDILFTATHLAQVQELLKLEKEELEKKKSVAQPVQKPITQEVKKVQTSNQTDTQGKKYVIYTNSNVKPKLLEFEKIVIGDEIKVNGNWYKVSSIGLNWQMFSVFDRGMAKAFFRDDIKDIRHK